MHEMTTDHVHEEIQLLAIDFSTMLFETLGHVPAWRDHYLAHDQTPHYEYLRLQLQALQHLRGGRRWLLKSPQHLEQLPVLAEVFPDATVVVTHRDPVPVDRVDGRRWSPTPPGCTARRSTRRDRSTTGSTGSTRCCVAASATATRSRPTRSIDVRFDDFMADDLAVAAQVYELAGEPLTDEAPGRDGATTSTATSGAGSAGRDQPGDVRARPRPSCASGSRPTSSASCPERPWPRSSASRARLRRVSR